MGAIGILALFLRLYYIKERMLKMIIEEISINSNDYPEQLKNIYDPPLKLYVLGNKEILKQKIQRQNMAKELHSKYLKSWVKKKLT